MYSWWWSFLSCIQFMFFPTFWCNSDLASFSLANHSGPRPPFYRPQRSWGKVMFLHESVILFTGGSAPLHAGIHTPPGPGTPHPLGPDTPPGTRHTSPLGPGTPQDQAPPWDQVPPRTMHPPRHSACWEIWATSGWYASYWNAILFMFFFCFV